MRTDGPVRPRPFGILAALLVLSACAPQPMPSVPFDPDEEQNRDIHEFNKDFDRTVFGPTAEGVSRVVPDPLEDGIGNVVDNLEEPGDFVNYILQLRPEKAVESGLRFAINSTVGVLGIFDPAAAIGLADEDTYFGETLYRYGFPQGEYAEVPFAGPTTDRDTISFIVGGYLNPLRYVVAPQEAVVVTALEVASVLFTRAEFDDVVDAVLYESADSYAQTRQIYLDRRRYELGQEADDAAFLDPYEDPYAE
jgi:phospholipid-binding lipoprotein MlaA